MEPTSSASAAAPSSPSDAAGPATTKERVSAQAAREDSSSVARRTALVTEEGVSETGVVRTKLRRRAARGRTKPEEKSCAPEAGESTSTISHTLSSTSVHAPYATSFPGAEVKRYASGFPPSPFFPRSAPEDLFSLCGGHLFKSFWISYRRTQPPLVILIDSFIVSLLLMAALLSCYVVVVGTSFPRNAFVAALLSCGGTAVLTVCLRTQVSEKNTFLLSEERALADYLLCNLVLHYAVFSYIG